MKHIIVSMFLAASVMAQGPVKVTKVPAPKKALVFEVKVAASLDEVWDAFTTSAGLSAWLVPGAVVDLRPGGEWTVHFPGGSTGGGTILSFTPKKELIMSALAPDAFPHVRAERTTADWEFRTEAGATVVKLTQTGWKEGDEWDKAYDYLATGNAQLLESLQQRFSKK